MTARMGPTVDERVAATVRADVRATRPYVVAHADGLIKLDAMENPYTLPAELRTRIGAAVIDTPLNRYPDGGAEATHAAIADAMRLPEGAALVLGNGSDELIQILSLLVATPGATILSAEPSFVMYRRSADVAQVRYVGVPLGVDFSLDAGAMLAAIERERPALTWLAYPNNPTGNLYDEAAIEAVIAAAPGLVVIDEAYQPFAERSFLPRVMEFPNVVVLRTLSKLGLAGLRLGYAVGNPAWIAEIEKLRPPYNINVLTQVVAPIVLREFGLLESQAAAIRGERARLAGALAAIPGTTVFHTAANFVLVRVPNANAWFTQLRGAGILVKNLDGYHPLTTHCLRITVGTPSENNALLAALAPFA
ncbi:MAG: histidinol-phosphate transaminase [Proteobacteria bacterium]|nr:histidinol-phosphate transaminase [Pseudomonadota bacterium]